MTDNFGYKFEGEELHSALMELMIRNLAMNHSILSLLCDIKEDDKEKSDKLFTDVQSESSEYAIRILQDLYERKGNIDLKDIL